MDKPVDDHGNFFFAPDDGHIPAVPVPLGKEAMQATKIELLRTDDGVEEKFEVRTQLGFHHGSTGIDVVVPGHGNTLPSDLTSTPNLFTWLIPKTGMYLPAALLHDGMVQEKGELPTHFSSQPISRLNADLIFRDAMAVLGVRGPRRWLIWTAVILADGLTGAIETKGRWPRGGRAWQWIMGLTLFVIIALGVLATRDLFASNPWLPWMRVEHRGLRVVSGAAAAVLGPALLSLLWWPLHRAALIAGVALAFLLHVSVVIIGLTTAFRLVDDPRALWRDVLKQFRKIFRPRPAPAADTVPRFP